MARDTTTPAPEAVGQRAMKEVHDGKAEQVGRQRLLHLHRRGIHRLRDAGLLCSDAEGYRLTPTGGQLVKALAPLQAWALHWWKSRAR